MTYSQVRCIIYICERCSEESLPIAPLTELPAPPNEWISLLPTIGDGNRMKEPGEMIYLCPSCAKLFFALIDNP